MKTSSPSLSTMTLDGQREVGDGGEHLGVHQRLELVDAAHGARGEADAYPVRAHT